MQSSFMNLCSGSSYSRPGAGILRAMYVVQPTLSYCSDGVPTRNPHGRKVPRIHARCAFKGTAVVRLFPSRGAAAPPLSPSCRPSLRVNRLFAAALWSLHTVEEEAGENQESASVRDDLVHDPPPADEHVWP